MGKFDRMCRNCKHYDVAAVRNSAGAVLRHRVAKCLWVPFEAVLFPASADYALKDAIKRMEEGNGSRYMEPDSGTDCRVFERRN